MATLRVISTSDAKLQGKSFEIQGELRIGRDPVNDVLVAEGRVSRRHARIIPTLEGMVIVDEGSDNGVWINQQRVTRHLLADGDQVGIGETTFRFENPIVSQQTIVMAGPPRVPAPPPPPPPSPTAQAPAPTAQAPPPVPPGGQTVPPALPSYAHPPAPVRQVKVPPQKAGGCAIGCLIFSILLLLSTIGGSVIFLYRAGYLPGVSAGAKTP